jgi:hypothetical protein
MVYVYVVIEMIPNNIITTGSDRIHCKNIAHMLVVILPYKTITTDLTS